MTAIPIGPSGGPPRIAVIGGGISGLAAAHRIVELLPGAELRLFESSGRLGGVLDTIHRNGFLVERSADNFLTTRPEAVDLCRRLGMAGELLPTNESRRRALVVRRGQLLPIPDGFFLMSPRKLWPVLTSPLLSLRGKLRLFAEPLVACRKSGVQDVRDKERSSGDAEQAIDDESVASFASRRLGREAFERLVQPLVAGMYTADAAKLSVAATMPEFIAYEREFGSLLRATLRKSHANNHSGSGARYSAFVAPRDGMVSLVQAIASRLPPDSVRLDAAVTKIHPADFGRWRLNTSAAPADSCEFDAVIVAAPAHAAARVIELFDRELAAELAAVEYADIAVVSSSYELTQIGHPLDGFGFVVPQIEKRRIVAASFASNKFPGRAREGSVLIRTFVGGSLQPELAQLPDNELQRVVEEELHDLLNIRGGPTWSNIARWPAAMPQYHVGHLARVARIESRLGRWPNLALAGNAYHGVGIPQCIASGEAAAERLIAQVRRRPGAA